MYGTRPSDGDSQPDWWIAEANYIDPQPPDASQYVALAHEINGHRAKILIRLAQRARSKRRDMLTA